MNSLYFPAHVVVIIRRLVNVVSTFSISNQYLLHRQTLPNSDESPSLNNLKQPFDGLSNVQWPWWTVKSNWDMRLGKIAARREICNSAIIKRKEISQITFVSFTFHLSSYHRSAKLAPESG